MEPRFPSQHLIAPDLEQDEFIAKSPSQVHSLSEHDSVQSSSSGILSVQAHAGGSSPQAPYSTKSYEELSYSGSPPVQAKMKKPNTLKVRADIRFMCKSHGSKVMVKKRVELGWTEHSLC